MTAAVSKFDAGLDSINSEVQSAVSELNTLNNNIGAAVTQAAEAIASTLQGLTPQFSSYAVDTSVALPNAPQYDIAVPTLDAPPSYTAPAPPSFDAIGAPASLPQLQPITAASMPSLDVGYLRGIITSVPTVPQTPSISIPSFTPYNEAAQTPPTAQALGTPFSFVGPAPVTGGRPFQYTSGLSDLITELSISTFGAPQAPALNLPNSPTLSTLGAIPAAPTLNQPTPPAAPTVNIQLAPVQEPTLYMPALPTLDDATIPTVPALTVPTAPAAPTLQVGQAPTITFDATVTEADLTDAKALAAELDGVVRDITPTYNALVAMSTAPVTADIDKEASRTVADTVDGYSRAGFVRPQGSLDARVDSVRAEMHNKKLVAILNHYQSLVEQAQKWRAEALQATNTLYQLFEHAHYAHMTNIIEVARGAMQASVETANAYVKYLNARIDAYNMEVKAFEAQLEQVRQQLSIVDVQIKVAQAVTDVNTAKIDAYKKQVDAEVSKIQLYKARLDAERLKLDAERTKVQVFSEQVNAFSTQVQAEVAKFEAYRAQLEAYKAPIEIDRAKADVFNSVVSAERIKVDLYETKVRAFTELTRTQIEEFKANLERARVLAERERTKSDINSAEVAADVAVYNALLEGEKAKIEAAIRYESAVTERYNADIRAFAEVSAAEGRRRDAVVKEFEAQIRYFDAQRGLYELDVQRYKAEIDRINAAATAIDAETRAHAAEVAKIQAEYKAQEAYNQSIARFAEADAARIGAVARVNEAKASAYTASVNAAKAAMDGYAAKASAVAAQMRAKAEVVRAQGAAFDTQAKAAATVVGIQGRIAESQARIDAAKAQINVEAARAAATIGTAQFDRALSTLESTRSVYSTYLSGLVSAINYNVSLGHTASISESYARSVQSAFSGQTVYEGVSLIPSGEWASQIDP